MCVCIYETYARFKDVQRSGKRIRYDDEYVQSAFFCARLQPLYGFSFKCKDGWLRFLHKCAINPIFFFAKQNTCMNMIVSTRCSVPLCESAHLCDFHLLFCECVCLKQIPYIYFHLFMHRR